jgi:superfamily I DNA/RNA helicase
MISYTDEQEAIIDLAQNPQVHLIKVSSVAGSGKTHTLKGVARALNSTNALYTAFNAAVIDEGRLTFPKNVTCKTLDAIAYQYVVRPHKYKIENFTIDSIKEKLQPHVKRQIIKAMEDFFKSASLDLMSITATIEKKYATIAIAYIEKMVEGEVPVTFDFCKKYLYLQMVEGNVVIDEYDLVMLDEAGDISEVTIEIFKRIIANKKIMVGDPHQNIYSFLNTVNGFEVLKNEGVELALSQSFRVSEQIAVNIERFCRRHLNPNMHFRGIHIEDKTIKSRAFISRTNSTMISRMMDLHGENINYTLLRTPKEIFKLPLALISISGNKPVDKEFAYLQTDKNNYLKSNLFDEAGKRMTFHRYLRELHSDDVNLVSALRLLETHSYGEIFDCYKKAHEQPKKRQTIVVTTAHVCKGQTYDSVFIEDDLNKSVTKAIKSNKGTEEELTELNLYYVAVSRARVELTNATVLDYEEKPEKKNK